MNKVTVTAPANIAFVKYWGARDLQRAIPLSSSISMTLRRCRSRTTVAFFPDDEREDDVRCLEDNAQRSETAFREGVRQHLEHMRAWAGRRGRFRMATRNSFPGSSGLASSASGFAALTLAATRAMQLDLKPEQLSVLARLSGSGSAARSVMGGYVEWPAANHDAYPAAPLAPWEHWDLRDVIAVVDTGPKPVSSREGHRRACTGPFFKTRLEQLPTRLEAVRQAIRERDLERLGQVLEEEAIELHLIAMSSRPPIFYWKPGTLAVLETVRALRAGGTAAYATMDAGANVHVICPAAEEPQVAMRLGHLSEVKAIIRDGVGPGPSLDAEHLF